MREVYVFILCAFIGIALFIGHASLQYVQHHENKTVLEVEPCGEEADDKDVE